jgi:predicted permease
MMQGWAGIRLDGLFVLRTLRKSPWYAVTAVVVLAGAVAVNAVVLGFVRGTLLHEAPYEDPASVMVVWGSNTRDGQLRDVISGPNYIEMVREARTLSAMAAFHHDDTYLTGGASPEVTQSLEVTADFFDVLGVRPLLGREFQVADRTSSAPATVLLSYAFWRDRFDSDPEALGRSLSIEGEPRTIIGVLPEAFEFIAPATLYTPLRDDILEADERSRIHYHVIGRLAPGASPDDVTLELSGIMTRSAREHTGYEGWSVLAEPLHRVAVSAVRPAIWTLGAVVGLVLLIALVNLATLFRMRTVSRAGEISVRMALGAGWTRVARVLSLETLGLALAGALAGLAAAPFLLERVTRMIPVWVAIPDSAVRVPVLRADLDPVVGAFAVGVVLLGAVALSLPGFASAIRGGARARSGRTHRALQGTRVLVGLELALATVLCLGAALTARSAVRLLDTEVGLEDRGLLTLWVGDVWGLEYDEQATYFREIVREVESIPGVTSAGVIDYVDFLAEDDYARVYFLDRSFQPTSSQREEWRRVGEGLFETAGIRVLEGRSFTRRDLDGAPRTAVVNEAFARKHYPDGGALGRFISTHDQAYRDLEIVGVVADVRSLGPAAPPPPMLYVPLQGSPRGTNGMYVRVEGEPMAYADAVRTALWSVDPTQPITGIQPMSDLVGSWVAIPRATSTLISTLAGLALLLATVGVFGVVAYAVRSRTSELGIRLALGASPRRLRRDILAGTLPLVLLGISVGMASGVVAARAARAVLFGVGPADPVSMTMAVAAMTGAALLATYLPSRRVERIDPTEAIRSE